MIYAHKLLTGKLKIKADDVLTLKSRSLRGHNFKIQKKKATKLASINVFSSRIVNDWNDLPSAVVSVTSTNAFKNAIDEHWKDRLFQTPY